MNIVLHRLYPLGRGVITDQIKPSSSGVQTTTYCPCTLYFNITLIALGVLTIVGVLLGFLGSPSISPPTNLSIAGYAMAGVGVLGLIALAIKQCAAISCDKQNVQIGKPKSDNVQSATTPQQIPAIAMPEQFWNAITELLRVDLGPDKWVYSIVPEAWKEAARDSTNEKSSDLLKEPLCLGTDVTLQQMLLQSGYLNQLVDCLAQCFLGTMKPADITARACKVSKQVDQRTLLPNLAATVFSSFPAKGQSVAYGTLKSNDGGLHHVLTDQDTSKQLYYFAYVDRDAKEGCLIVQSTTEAQKFSFFHFIFRIPSWSLGRFGSHFATNWLGIVALVRQFIDAKVSL